MKCKFCGNEVTKESSVCPCCGARLIKKQVTESMTKNDSYNPSVKKTTEMEVNAIQKTNFNEQMNNIEIIESSKIKGRYELITTPGLMRVNVEKEGYSTCKTTL
mgnify:CR=1 FL=1